MRLKKIKGAIDRVKKGRYYIDNPSMYRGKWGKLFNNDNEIYVELGMGKGDFIINNAIKYPFINFIGIEKYDSVLVKAVEKSNLLELDNLKLILMDVSNLDSIFDHEVDKIYLNFSDPWPKERHAKRRLTSKKFLEVYDKVFKSDKVIEMKTDNIDLFNYSVESLKDNGYNIEYITNDLHNEEVENIMTEYEEKFSSRGEKINKLIARK